jgi:protein-L-isoaspartate(D-aspartate) O-methyltransferase
MTEVTADSARAAELRERLADELVAEGTIVSKEVEAAFRTVPRHLFAPGATLEEAYDAAAVVRTKRAADGSTMSSVSAPQIQARMVEQAGITRGMRVLKIGSGGYNAAVIAELVGPEGQVTTLDIDADVTDRASHLLDEAGYSRIHVALGESQAHRIRISAGASLFHRHSVDHSDGREVDACKAWQANTHVHDPSSGGAGRRYRTQL